MKKLFSMVLGLCMGMAAQAQSLTLTVDGEQLANGGSLTKTYGVEAFDLMPGTPLEGQFFRYGLYPEVMINSTTAQHVSATLTDVNKDGGVTFCFGGNCMELDKNGYSVTKEQTLKASTPTNMQIDVVHAEESATAYGVTLSLKVKGESETFEGTIVLKYDPETAHISSPALQGETGCYTLSGLRIKEATKRGIYIRGGRKIVISR